MKYSKALSKAVFELPPDLQNDCISYKKWKKFCKTARSSNECLLGLTLLEKQCDNVDKRFKEHYDKLYNVPLYLQPFIQCGIINILAPTDILKYAHINSQTVYKVCKKLMKTYHSTLPIEWLTNTRSQHKYTFMGSYNTTHLEVKLTGHAKCPICLDTICLDENNKIIVFGCGHYGCIDCVLHYAGVDDMKGTWFNLLTKSKKTDCPICRHKHALMDAILIKQ